MKWQKYRSACGICGGYIRRAKSDKLHRFWGLFVPVRKTEAPEEAYRAATKNGGAPGVDSRTFFGIEQAGRDAFPGVIREERITNRRRPMSNRRADMPKGDGKVRTLQILCIRDRVAQGALKRILEAVFGVNLSPNSCGFRPRRSPHRALQRRHSGCAGAGNSSRCLERIASRESPRHPDETHTPCGEVRWARCLWENFMRGSYGEGLASNCA